MFLNICTVLAFTIEEVRKRTKTDNGSDKSTKSVQIPEFIAFEHKDLFPQFSYFMSLMKSHFFRSIFPFILETPQYTTFTKRHNQLKKCIVVENPHSLTTHPRIYEYLRRTDSTVVVHTFLPFRSVAHTIMCIFVCTLLWSGRDVIGLLKFFFLTV